MTVVMIMISIGSTTCNQPDDLIQALKGQMIIYGNEDDDDDDDHKDDSALASPACQKLQAREEQDVD